MSGRKIGVYVCQCGGNISDYVDVDKVVAAVKHDPDVVVARSAMFTCSDSTQQEIIEDAHEKGLDALVVASCSPKLHTVTFRDVAKRAGMNPFQYTQVNVREQCSWTHTDDEEGATDKAVRLVRAGINRTRLTEPLEPIVVETTPKSLVVGGGIAGLRAALGLAEIGLTVYLVEKAPQLGGWVADFGHMYPHGRNGADLVATLEEKVRANPAITVFTNAEVMSKSGSFGNLQATIAVHGERLETITVDVALSSSPPASTPTSRPSASSGTASTAWSTLPEFKKMVDESAGPLAYDGRPVKTVAYIYCVGSRQGEDVEGGHTVLLALLLHGRRARRRSRRPSRATPACASTTSTATCAPTASTSCCGASRARRGSVYLRVPDGEPPRWRSSPGAASRSRARPAPGGEELAIPADLVVLVTGMVPRENGELVNALKLPVGGDGFLNEIHPKLRPVETVVDGVFICGTCQSPKNSAESVAAASPPSPRAAPSSSAASPSSTPWWRSSTRTPAPGAASASRPVPTTPSSRSRRRAGGRPRHQDRLQGLRRLRAGVRQGRGRPAGLHRRPDQGDDRRSSGSEPP